MKTYDGDYSEDSTVEGVTKAMRIIAEHHTPPERPKAELSLGDLIAKANRWAERVIREYPPGRLYWESFDPCI